MNFRQTIILFLTLSSALMYAQDGKFSVGGTLGLPLGDLGKVSSFVIAADVNYMFNAEEDFSYGAAASIQYFLAKSENGVSGDSASVLPIAAAGRYKLSDQFSIGADLGYAIALSPSESKGGIFYRPIVGYSLNDNMQLTASFSAYTVSETSEGVTISRTNSFFGVGIMYGL